VSALAEPDNAAQPKGLAHPPVLERRSGLEVQRVDQIRLSMVTLQSGVVRLGVSAGLARLPARLMMIAVAVGAERSQSIARRTVVVMRIIVAAAKRVAWLIARRKMSVYNGCSGRIFGRSRMWKTAIIAPAMDVSGRGFLARGLVGPVGESHDGARSLAMRTQSVRLSRARSRRNGRAV